MDAVIGVAWLAATVAPRTIAPHPNFSVTNVSGPELLALVADYRAYDLSRYRDLRTQLPLPWENLLLDHAADSLIYIKQKDAAEHLWLLSVQTDVPIGARVSSALFASVAQAELDEPEVAAERLDSLVRQMESQPEIEQPSGRIVMAVLRQQLALRWYESMEPERAATELQIVVDLCSSVSGKFEAFQVSRGISWGPSRVQLDIAAATRHHALTLRSQLESFEGTTWQQVVRSRPAWINTRIDGKAAGRDSAFVSEAFSRTIESVNKKYRIGGTDTVLTEGLAALLLAELNGAFLGVMNSRNALGRIRLMRPDGDPVFSTREALRLLRVGRKDDALDSSLQLVRSQGPNQALIEAARLILERSSFPRKVANRDLKVLAAASDFMSQEDLRASIEGAWSYLSDLPSNRRAGITDYEDAWKAISRLLPDSDTHAATAEQALSFLREFGVSVPSMGRTFLRLVETLDWTQVSPADRSDWLHWASNNRDGDLGELARTVLSMIDRNRTGTKPQRRHGLELAAEIVNARIGSGVEQVDDIAEANSACIEALSAIRRDAANGRYSLGGLDAGEIAVAFASAFNETHLWRAIVDFLSDPNVRPESKARALDRISHPLTSVPTTAVEALSPAWSSIIEQRSSRGFFDERPQMSHFPEALRAGSSLRLMEREPVLTAVTELAGDESSIIRIEACRSIPQATRAYDSVDWGHVLLLQLSHDRDPVVRAESGRALALIGSLSGSMSTIVDRRIDELLVSEGIVVPLLTLHGFQAAISAGDRKCAASHLDPIDEIEHHHSARVVRGAAGEAMRLWRWGER